EKSVPQPSAQPPPITPKGAAPAYVAGQAAYPPADEGMFDRLFRLLAGRKPDVTAHFEVIGLEPIRRRFELHWEDIEDKVHIIVRHVIGKHLRAGDSFVPVNKQRYLITFAQTSAAEARQRAALIREEILRIFISDRLLGPHIGVAVSDFRRTRPARQSGAKQTPPGAPPPHPHAHSQAAAHPEADPTAGEGAKHAAPLIFRGMAPLHGSNDRDAQRPMLIRDENGRGILPPHIGIRYRAVYDQAVGKVTSYRYMSHYKIPDGAELYEYDVLPEDADDEMYLELDLKMLEAVAQAHEQRGNGHADDIKLLCPVHYKTLANPELRKKYLQACNII